MLNVLMLLQGLKWMHLTLQERERWNSWDISARGEGEGSTHTHVNVDEKTSTLDLPTSVRASDQRDSSTGEKDRGLLLATLLMYYGHTKGEQQIEVENN